MFNTLSLHQETAAFPIWYGAPSDTTDMKIDLVGWHGPAPRSDIGSRYRYDKNFQGGGIEGVINVSQASRRALYFTPGAP
jgi:hypothetical protein